VSSAASGLWPVWSRGLHEWERGTGRREIRRGQWRGAGSRSVFDERCVAAGIGRCVIKFAVCIASAMDGLAEPTVLVGGSSGALKTMGWVIGTPRRRGPKARRNQGGIAWAKTPSGCAFYW